MENIKYGNYPNLIAQNAKIDPEYKDLATQLSRDTIFEFLELCKVPRPSKYMNKIREYLINWVEDHPHLGLKGTLDESGCVIIDIPASKDCDKHGVAYSDYPNIILQAHMDMVPSAVKEYRHCNCFGKRWEPKDDPIPAVYDRNAGTVSTNNKCSLGADDGQGIALCLAIAKNNQIPHGPIRCLFTYDEEVNMQGVRNLEPDRLNAEYLINLDSIYVGTVLNSASGGFEGQMAKLFQTVPSPNKTTMITIRMGGLAGGHSGEDIAKGHGSSVEIGINILTRLNKQNISFGISKLKAGSAMNAISTTMKIIMIVNDKDVSKVENIIKEEMESASKSFVGGDKLDYTISTEPSFGAFTVARDDSVTIVKNISKIPNGPLEMLDNGVPETSCNIGLWDVREGHFTINFLYRSCLEKKQDSAYELFLQIADDIKADLMLKAIFPAWKRLEENPLNRLFMDSYKKVCGFNGESIDIHSGLECGYLSQKNPDLKMASVGCDLVYEHTPKETLYTKSMPAFMASLLYVLNNINSI